MLSKVRYESKRCCVCCCCPYLSPALVLAQSDRGSITGTVSDPTGALIPAAKVVATRADTGAVYQTVTTNTGNYTLPSLPVGVYSLSVEAPGSRNTFRTVSPLRPFKWRASMSL